MWPGVIFDEDSRVGETLPPVALDILNFALMAWSWQEQGAPPGLADPTAPLFALVGRERGDPHLSEPSLLPRVEEAPLVTPTDSHLKDKDLRGNVVEVDHVGEGNPHAQKSCRKERSKQVQLGGGARAPRGAQPVPKSSVHRDTEFQTPRRGRPLLSHPLYRMEN